MDKIVKLNGNLKHYPYINLFVEKMDELNVKQYFESNDDMVVFFSFMNLYIKSCNILKNNNIELTNDNIKYIMNIYFEKTHMMDICCKIKDYFKLLE